MVYTIIKESSLVLMDACQCKESLKDIENVAGRVKNVRRVHSLRMRKLGPYLVGDMHVVVDGGLTVRDSARIAHEIEERVKKEFDDVIDITVRIDPDETMTN
jgi:divalent metal cation (Fe/Co/Zn/Cd) transporter